MVLLLAPLFATFQGSEQNEFLGAWLLIISAFIFGLPHGACDLWILQNTARRSKKSAQTLSILFSVYLLLALLTIAIWFVVPGIALVGFLLLTAWHFGSGDSIWSRSETKQWIINSLGRGLIVIFAPIAFYSALSRNVLEGLSGASNLFYVEFILSAAPILVGLGIFFLFAETFFFGEKTKSKNELIKWTEIAIILFMFWTTPPLLAVTVYLIGVHSWRHILRLETYDEKVLIGENQRTIWHSIVNFHKKALPMTALSLFGLIGIIWFWNINLNDIFQLSYGYLILLSALTVPHATLISWIETRKTNKSVNETKTLLSV